MEIMEAVRAGLKELILPELDKIKEENGQIKVAIELTNKRLDDINLHLADQSRRIDDINKRIGEVRAELTERMERVRAELTNMINEARKTFDGRMDYLFQVVVRRDEHYKLENRLSHLEREVQKIKIKVAA